VDDEGNIALYYVALDGYAMTALKEKSKHIKGHKPYKRTRWADPDAHGGAKYHTEYGSGAELYLTQRVVAASPSPMAIPKRTPWVPSRRPLSPRDGVNPSRNRRGSGHEPRHGSRAGWPPRQRGR
jgi:hypothetical protein